jgi:hypothetical protein
MPSKFKLSPRYKQNRTAISAEGKVDGWRGEHAPVEYFNQIIANQWFGLIGFRGRMAITNFMTSKHKKGITSLNL